MSDAFIGHRNEYSLHGLDIEDLDPDPIAQLEKWLSEAVAVGMVEPSAMSLATADKGGKPSNRVVLLRGLDERGLVFYTNYESRKGQELKSNPWAAVCFWWPQLERQARVEGKVSRVPKEESDAYFAVRPRESRLASAASPQSRPVKSRHELEASLRELAERYPAEVPRPKHWGGYRLKPIRFEFWQGRPARLHDRFAFDLLDGTWQIVRLAP